MSRDVRSKLSVEFIQAMSRAACTVSVVTTDGLAGRYGLTVSAMSSVSADLDKPVLLVCVEENSSAARPIKSNGIFCVNLLRGDQAEIADCFAGRLKTPSGNKFDCTQWTTHSTGAPAVRDALATFDCRLISIMHFGKHDVLFGSVEHVHVEPNGEPLIYVQRRYGRLSSPLAT